MDTSQKQLQTVDEFLTDAAARGRVQMDRAEIFLDDAMARAQDTVAMVHGTVITPLRQINGVATGVRAALQFFLRGNPSESGSGHHGRRDVYLRMPASSRRGIPADAPAPRDVLPCRDRASGCPTR